MLKISKKPFIEYQIENLSRHGIKDIILLVVTSMNYLKKMSKKILNSKVICINEKKPLGTGGGLLILKRKLNKYFYVLNGDTIFDINYLDFEKFQKKISFV